MATKKKEELFMDCCSSESCLTESPSRPFEAVSPQILREKDLSRFIPSPDSTHVVASDTESALFFIYGLLEYEK